MTRPDLAAVILDSLDDEALADLAQRLRPHLELVVHAAFLTPQAAAEQLGLHPKTVVRMAREGRLPGAVKVGKGWRFPADRLTPEPPASLGDAPPTLHRARRRTQPSASVAAIRGTTSPQIGRGA